MLFLFRCARIKKAISEPGDVGPDSPEGSGQTGGGSGTLRRPGGDHGVER